MTFVKERRRFARRLIGGNAEITSVVGGSETLPPGRAKILNCSRGGALLAVPSPERRLFKRMPPCLSAQDSITCVLRFPPAYQEIEVFAEVRRVVRPVGETEVIHVAIRFFYDVQRKSGMDRHLNALRRVLGQAAWGESSIVNQRVARIVRPKAAQVVSRSTSKRSKRSSGSKRLKTKSDSGRRRSSSESKRVKRKQGSSTSKRLRREKAEPAGRTKRRSAGKASTKPDHRVAHKKVLQPRPSKVPGRNLNAFANLEQSSIVLDSALFIPDELLQARNQPTISRPQPSIRPAPRPNGSRNGTGGAARTGQPTINQPTGQPTIGAPRRTAEPVVYFGLAGPESGLYVRGRARLVGGRATIELPEHFSRSVVPSTVTVHLTPGGECFGLYVAERSASQFVVRELGGGASQVAFDWYVMAQRR